MVQRHNHYEVAFEEYLRSVRSPYVAVDESRRSLLGDHSIKNLDFIVSPAHIEQSWLIDVKGRRFPTRRGGQYWRNWSTWDDIQGLAQWEHFFGNRFVGILLFAYHVIGDQSPLPAEELFEFRGKLYGFIAVRLDHYASWAKPISTKWQTLAVPTERFRQLGVPFSRLVTPGKEAAMVVKAGGERPETGGEEGEV